MANRPGFPQIHTLNLTLNPINLQKLHNYLTSPKSKTHQDSLLPLFSKSPQKLYKNQSTKNFLSVLLLWGKKKTAQKESTEQRKRELASSSYKERVHRTNKGLSG